jgi:hypothetical protein
MKCEKECILEKSINKFNNLNNNEIYNITGIISLLTAIMGTFGLVFGNTMFFLLSPLILLISYHCNFLMEDKI